MALVSGVLEELIDTHVIDAGDLARITGSTTRSVSRWTAGKGPYRAVTLRTVCSS